MGYSIYLVSKDPKSFVIDSDDTYDWDAIYDSIVSVESHQEGSTFAIGGLNEARISVTYNYAEIYSLVDFSMHSLDGKRASDTIDFIDDCVKKLGTKTYRDYWAPTPGNAGKALNILLKWAKENPDAYWMIS